MVRETGHATATSTVRRRQEWSLEGHRGPGRPGWLPTPPPHRSGLAHHVTRFLIS